MHVSASLHACGMRTVQNRPYSSLIFGECPWLTYASATARRVEFAAKVCGNAAKPVLAVSGFTAGLSAPPGEHPFTVPAEPRSFHVFTNGKHRKLFQLVDADKKTVTSELPPRAPLHLDPGRKVLVRVTQTGELTQQPSRAYDVFIVAADDAALERLKAEGALLRAAEQLQEQERALFRQWQLAALCQEGLHSLLDLEPRAAQVVRQTASKPQLLQLFPVSPVLVESVLEVFRGLGISEHLAEITTQYVGPYKRPPAELFAGLQPSPTPASAASKDDALLQLLERAWGTGVEFVNMLAPARFENRMETKYGSAWEDVEQLPELPDRKSSLLLRPTGACRLTLQYQYWDSHGGGFRTVLVTNVFEGRFSVAEATPEQAQLLQELHKSPAQPLSQPLRVLTADLVEVGHPGSMDGIARQCKYWTRYSGDMEAVRGPERKEPARPPEQWVAKEKYQVQEEERAQKMREMMRALQDPDRAFQAQLSFALSADMTRLLPLTALKEAPVGSKEDPPALEALRDYASLVKLQPAGNELALRAADCLVRAGSWLGPPDLDSHFVFYYPVQDPKEAKPADLVPWVVS